MYGSTVLKNYVTSDVAKSCLHVRLCVPTGYDHSGLVVNLSTRLESSQHEHRSPVQPAQPGARGACITFWKLENSVESQHDKACCRGARLSRDTVAVPEKSSSSAAGTQTAWLRFCVPVFRVLLPGSLLSSNANM